MNFYGWLEGQPKTSIINQWIFILQSGEESIETKDGIEKNRDVTSHNVDNFVPNELYRQGSDFSERHMKYKAQGIGWCILWSYVLLMNCSTQDLDGIGLRSLSLVSKDVHLILSIEKWNKLATEIERALLLSILSENSFAFHLGSCIDSHSSC